MVACNQIRQLNYSFYNSNLCCIFFYLFSEGWIIVTDWGILLSDNQIEQFLFFLSLKNVRDFLHFIFFLMSIGIQIEMLLNILWSYYNPFFVLGCFLVITKCGLIFWDIFNGILCVGLNVIYWICVAEKYLY